ncbi:MAG: hypothetical protein ABW166_14270 [Sedimenticola sp.]
MKANGFLFWNFPKARIFMGDAGSGFVGIVLTVNPRRLGGAGVVLGLGGWMVCWGCERDGIAIGR